MSDYLKEHPLLQQLIFLIMLTAFSLVLGKPYVDRKDAGVKSDIHVEFLEKMDELVRNDSTILEALKTLR